MEEFGVQDSWAKRCVYGGYDFRMQRPIALSENGSELLRHTQGHRAFEWYDMSNGNRKDSEIGAFNWNDSYGYSVVMCESSLVCLEGGSAVYKEERVRRRLLAGRDLGAAGDEKCDRDEIQLKELQDKNNP